MKALAVLAVLAAAGGLAAAGYPGVRDADQAGIDYMLKCQGCHRPDGTGDARSNPALAGVVATYLAAPGGREYLARVPGIATSALDDARLADLLNWTLYRFDRAHVPVDFKPYTAAEVGALRARPLRTEAEATRQALVAWLKAHGGDYP
jgi:cytochrome c553